MKAGFLGVAAAGLVAATAGSAPAQFVIGGPVYRPVPVYTAPSVSVGFGYGTGGFRVGGFYSTFPSYGYGYYRPAVSYPGYGWGGYYRPYYGGYHGGYHHHHHHHHGYYR